MARLRKQDSEFRHPGLSYLDFKTVDMDRVLTGFLARLKWQGLTSRLARRSDVQVGDFVDEIFDLERSGIGFRGFAEAGSVAHRWVETHLVDMVSRGRATQAVAGLRPLHGSTYRYRNSKHSRAYNADEQLYEMLAGAPGRRGPAALEGLREFFFSGIDPATGTVQASSRIDVETQALLHLCNGRSAPDDRPDTRRLRHPYPPFCPASAELLADDVLRLLHHQRVIPRSVLVDYLKILLAFHLGTYHLRLISSLPEMVTGRGRHRCRLPDGTTAPESSGTDCQFRIGLLVDVVGRSAGPMAELARRSAAHWWQRIPSYIRAAYEVKKLDEFADYLVRRRALARPPGVVFGIDDAIGLGQRVNLRKERDAFFAQRLTGLVESVDADELPEEVTQILDLGLDDRTAYLDILAALRGDFHRKYLTESLDSLLLKNRPGAAIAQPHKQARRFILDSRLIEVLLQISLLRAEGGTFRTRPLRIDEFLTVLRIRYGIYVDRLPNDEGFGPPGIGEHAALRENTRAFTDRLREIGYYSDLSDAYLTQTILPRYRV